jgi:hypothetical protein
MLSAEQQERYSRHLLLDGFDQEKLLAACVHVHGTSAAALWAARYLAASGVGGLIVDEPAWEPELRALGPWLLLGAAAAEKNNFFFSRREITPQGGPAEGALAAMEVVRDP